MLSTLLPPYAHLPAFTPPATLPNTFKIHPMSTQLTHIDPPFANLGLLLAEIEDQNTMEAALRKISNAVERGKLSIDEQFQILDVAALGYKYEGTLAHAMLEIAFYQAYIQQHPDSPILAEAYEKIEAAKAQKIKLADYSANEIPAEDLPQRPLVNAAQQETLDEQKNKQKAALGSRIEGQLNWLSDHAKDRDVVIAMAKTRVELSLLLGHSQSELAQACVRIAGDADLELIPLFYETAIKAMPPGHTHAQAVLAFQRDRARLHIAPSSILDIAPEMALAYGRISAQLPQTFGQLSTVTKKIKDLITQAKETRPHAQDDEIMGIFNEVWEDTLAKRKNSLFHLLLEITKTECELEYLPADDEARQRLGYLKVCLAYKQNKSPKEIAQMSKKVLSSKLLYNQKVAWMLGADLATAEGSPEKLMLACQLDHFMFESNSEHAVSPEVLQRAYDLRKINHLLGSRPPTFSTAFAALLRERSRIPSCEVS